jgi:eukaryotic-like serine/threonine-protein kinase
MFSHYRVVERLGSGGMGEVYRARDEKLGRDVALKVLPSGALADEEARRRFRKEAAALSRLGHPHIATLFDFDTTDGTDFLVMELVVGPTLEEELGRGPLAEKELVRLGAQLARGLMAAHEHGVIHRDLKPSNLGLTSDGLLKILDFGLAHLVRSDETKAQVTTATESAIGHVVGSPPYMAPEQLLGKAVDARTDLYAAGACLYELATGRRPHGEKRGPSLTEAILHEAPPPPRTICGAISPGLEAVVLKALDKDPRLRYQAAKELLVDLERLGQASLPGAATQPVAAARRRRRRRWLVAGAAAVVLLAVAAWPLRPLPRPRITNLRPVTKGLGASLLGFWGNPSWATDGVRLYYVSVSRTQDRAALYQVSVTGGEAVEIPLPFRFEAEIAGYLARESALLITGSGGAAMTQDRSPGAPALWVVPVPAGTPRRLAGLRAYTAAVSAAGNRVAFWDGELLRTAAIDGSDLHNLPGPPTTYGGVFIQQLRWSPDGHRLRYDAPGPDGQTPWIWEVDAASGSPRALWPGQVGDWTADGRYYLFSRCDGTRCDLFSMRERPWIRSHAQAHRLTFGPTSFWRVGSSQDSRRLFAWGRTYKGELLRYDASARGFVSYLGGESATDVDISRDGQWLAWVAWPEGTLWRSRVDGSERIQLTRPGLHCVLPRWSPDGRRIVFSGRASEEGALSVRIVSAEGGDPQTIASPDSGHTLWDSCWLPDGRTVVFSYQQNTRPGLFRVDVETRRVTPFPGAEHLQFPKCSAQGRILAMQVVPAEPAEVARFQVFRPERGEWEALGPVRGGTYATWTRNGEAFVGLNVLQLQIERYSLVARRTEILADARRLRLVTVGGYPWMGLAPDDSPLVTRDHSTGELYALDWEAP